MGMNEKPEGELCLFIGGPLDGQKQMVDSTKEVFYIHSVNPDSEFFLPGGSKDDLSLMGKSAKYVRKGGHETGGFVYAYAGYS